VFAGSPETVDSKIVCIPTEKLRWALPPTAKPDTLGRGSRLSG
jgi:hypothetical protein